MSAGVKRLLRWAGLGLAGLAVVAVFLLSWSSVKWTMHVRRTYVVPAVDLAGVHGDPRRGEYLVTVGAGCVECHGEDLAGGTVVEDPVAGHIYGPNISRAALKDWTDGELARVIHNGVKKDGHSVVIMPSDTYQYMCREDVADMVAYLRHAPAVERANRGMRVGALIKIIWAAGKMPGVFPAEVVEHERAFTAKVPEGPTRAYGAYLFKSHCAGCHREDGRGGKIANGPPDWPPAANLTEDGAGGWTQEGFIKTFRTGINPSGSKVQPPMGDAIRKFGKKMKENDLKAIWEHLRTLKGVELS